MLVFAIFATRFLPCRLLPVFATGFFRSGKNLPTLDLWGGSVRLRWWVLSQMASGFKASPFTQNHLWSLNRQRSRQATDIYWSDEVSEMKNWVSSTYCWWWIPVELMMWPTGEVKVEKRRGPSTDPCGTPNRPVTRSEINQEEAKLSVSSGLPMLKGNEHVRGVNWERSPNWGREAPEEY